MKVDFRTLGTSALSRAGKIAGGTRKLVSSVGHGATRVITSEPVKRIALGTGFCAAVFLGMNAAISGVSNHLQNKFLSKVSLDSDVYHCQKGKELAFPKYSYFQILKQDLTLEDPKSLTFNCDDGRKIEYSSPLAVNHTKTTKIPIIGEMKAKYGEYLTDTVMTVVQDLETVARESALRAVKK